MRGVYTYTHLRVYLYITVCVAGGVAKLRALRAAGRQPGLTTHWVPVKQVAVSRLRGDSLDAVEAVETVDSVISVDSVRYSSRASYILEHTARMYKLKLHTQVMAKEQRILLGSMAARGIFAHLGRDCRLA